MAIMKNEIPILEYDTEQTAVLNPTHENLGLNLPKKCVFAFLGDYIEEYAGKTDTRQVSTFVSATKRYPVYITKSSAYVSSVMPAIRYNRLQNRAPPNVSSSESP